MEIIEISEDKAKFGILRGGKVGDEIIGQAQGRCGHNYATWIIDKVTKHPTKYGQIVECSRKR